MIRENKKSFIRSKSINLSIYLSIMSSCVYGSTVIDIGAQSGLPMGTLVARVSIIRPERIDFDQKKIAVHLSVSAQQNGAPLPVQGGERDSLADFNVHTFGVMTEKITGRHIESVARINPMRVANGLYRATEIYRCTVQRTRSTPYTATVNFMDQRIGDVSGERRVVDEYTENLREHDLPMYFMKDKFGRLQWNGHR